jgi:hypothetical protein
VKARKSKGDFMLYTISCFKIFLIKKLISKKFFAIVIDLGHTYPFAHIKCD